MLQPKKEKYINYFFLRTFAFIIFGIVSGIFIDEILFRLQNKYKITDIDLVILQTMINVFLIWIFYTISYYYIYDFFMNIQSTIPGVFFSTFYFGIQFNYFTNLKSIFYID